VHVTDQGCLEKSYRRSVRKYCVISRSTHLLFVPDFLADLSVHTGTVINPELNVDLRRIPSILDFGDIDEGVSLEEGHAKLRDVVHAILSKGAIPFVIGGGNDQSYPNIAALLDTGVSNVGVVNIDAHLDVRPKKNDRVHSGTPFRQLLEDSRFDGKKFLEFGAQGD
jgi:formiminoglutamase